MNWIVQALIMLYFVSMFALGILGRFRTKDTADYYVAGRNINGVLTALVYVTTLVSAGALVGWVSQTWQWGLYFLYAANAVTIATFLCWRFLGLKIRSVSRKMDLYTIPDFLEKRFESNAARMVASVILIVFPVPLLVSQLKAIGILFNVVTGLSYEATVICFGVIVFMYVAFGGYFAVVYTDAIQAILMLVGVCVLFISAAVKVGGGAVTQYAQIFPAGCKSWPDKEATTTPMFLIAFVLLTFFGALGSPNYIRGFYSIRNVKAFKQGFTILMLIVVPLEVIIVMIGFLGRILFPTIDSPDNVVYYMIQTLLSPFFAGITLAALAAAVMSTADSLLIQCASTVENDILTKTLHLRLSDKKRVTIARITVFIIGIICVVWSLNPPRYLALLMYPAWGAMGLTFSWVFFLGLYWKRFNKAGVITAMLTSSLAFAVWSAFGNPLGLYHIQVALLVSIPSSIIVTLLNRPTSRETLDKFFPEKQAVKR